MVQLKYRVFLELMRILRKMSYHSEIYGIASAVSKSCGKDSLTVFSIESMDPYGGDLPPFFEDKQDAQDWLDGQDLHRDCRVARLELRTYHG